MIVRLSQQKSSSSIANIEALLAGMILTVSTAYAATVCPMYWTQLQLEADLRNRVAIANAVDRWHLEHGNWPDDNLSDLRAESLDLEGIPLSNPLTGQPYCLESVMPRLRMPAANN